jgi:hypothetical protein
MADWSLPFIFSANLFFDLTKNTKASGIRQQ